MTGLLLTGLLLTQTPAPQAEATPAPAPTLGELHAAQVDAHLSKVRALQAEIQLQQLALQRQRDTLEAAIAVAHPGFRMDWTTGQLVPAAPAAKEPSK